MEKGTKKKQRVVIKRTAATRKAKSGFCTLRKIAACACLSFILSLAFLIFSVAFYKDPKVSYNDFEFTSFEVKTFLTLPVGLKIGWKCHLTVDNTENMYGLKTEATKIFLLYGKNEGDDQKNIDTVDFGAVNLKARESVIETIEHTHNWSIKDIPKLVQMGIDWSSGKDLEYHIKTDMPVSVLFVKKLVKIDCSVIVKGGSLKVKQKMKCDVKYF